MNVAAVGIIIVRRVQIWTRQFGDMHFIKICLEPGLALVSKEKKDIKILNHSIQVVLDL